MRRSKHLILGIVAVAIGALILAGLAFSPSVTRQSSTSPTATAMDTAHLASIVTEHTERLLIPGAVALVVTPDGEVSTTVGRTHLDGGDPVTLDHHIRIGSNTKTWTGTVILQLVDEGLLSLDDPISTFWPEVPRGDNITIEHLLAMRSGLANYTETFELNNALDTDPERVWQPKELVDMGIDLPSYFEPGTDFHYSNTNTVLLGLVAEQVTDTPMADLISERLLTPLGMNDSHFPETDDATLPDPYSRGYMYWDNAHTIHSAELPIDMAHRAVDETLKPGDHTGVNPSWAWSAGAGISTARDLATWVEALVSDDLLSSKLQATRLDSVQPIDPGDPNSASYGLGIAQFGALYGHTGELPGYNSFMGYDPDTGVTVVVWANLAPGFDGTDPATEIARDILAQMYPHLES